MEPARYLDFSTVRWRIGIEGEQLPERDRQKVWGLATFLIALALLPACGSATEDSGKTSTSPVATARTTTTAIAAPPTTPGPRTKKWIDLDVGDCLTDPPPSDPSVVTVTVIDCATPHQAEVFFRGALTVNTAIPEVANRECGAQFPKYTGQSVGDSGLAVTYLVDSNQDRTTIDPTTGPAPSTVICLLEDANGQPLTASARR